MIDDNQDFEWRSFQAGNNDEGRLTLKARLWQFVRECLVRIDNTYSVDSVFGKL